MATCRRCYTTNVRIPSSPRPLANAVENKENSSDMSNGLKRKLEPNDISEPKETRDSITRRTALQLRLYLARNKVSTHGKLCENGKL